MNNNSRNPLSFTDFSFRRILLQGARAARGSPQLGTRLCDVERGGNGKHDKNTMSSSNGQAGTIGGNGMSPGNNKVKPIAILMIHLI